MAVTRKLVVNFGLMMALICALSYVCFHTVRTLGGMVDIAFNENAKAAGLVGSIQKDLLEIRAICWNTQFAYVVQNLLKLEPTEANKRIKSELGDCASCHTFDGPQRRDSFAGGADRALKHTAQLKPLVHTETATRSIDAIAGGIHTLM